MAPWASHLRLAASGGNKEFAVVHRLSPREKREFYSGMARLIRSGSSLPNALALLARDTPRGLGDFLRALAARILAGETLADALLQQRPRISDLEAGIVAASSRGGRLDRGCEQLARYFQALEDARAALRSRLLYPFVLLHLSVFILALPRLIIGTGGVREYVEQTAGLLVAIYAATALGILLWDILSSAARGNAGLDTIMERVPALGAVRRNFALARFLPPWTRNWREASISGKPSPRPHGPATAAAS